MQIMSESKDESVAVKYRFLFDRDSYYASYEVLQIMNNLLKSKKKEELLESRPTFYKALEKVKNFDE